MSQTDEPTEKLKEPEEYETKPVVSLILERVNAIGDELTTFRAEFQQFKAETTARLGGIETELREFKEETRIEFRKVNKRLDIISVDIQKIRTDAALLEDRIDGLERQAS